MIIDGLRYEFIEGDGSLDAVFNVRRQVFIIGQNIPEEIEMDGLDREALQIAVSEGERVIGTARVRFPEAGLAKIERMAVLEEYRRRSIGSYILGFINDELRKRNIGKAVLHVQWEVKEFYRSCGFEETGCPFIEAGIKHIGMEKNIPV